MKITVAAAVQTFRPIQVTLQLAEREDWDYFTRLVRTSATARMHNPVLDLLLTAIDDYERAM